MLFNHGVGEDSWESLGLQRNQRSNPKGNQSWIFIGRIDVEAETPILWPPDAKNWFIGKNPDAGKDRRQKEKGAAENEMVRKHHWLNSDWVICSMNLSKLQELVLQSLGSQRVGHDWATELNWEVKNSECQGGQEVKLQVPWGEATTFYISLIFQTELNTY